MPRTHFLDHSTYGEEIRRQQRCIDAEPEIPEEYAELDELPETCSDCGEFEPHCQCTSVEPCDYIREGREPLQ